MDIQRPNVFILSFLTCVAAVLVQAGEPESAKDSIWLLNDMDLTDAQSLVIKLSEPSDAVSADLRDYCSETTERLLAEYDGSQSPNAELREALLADLNRIIEESDWYQEKMFEQTAFPAAAKNAGASSQKTRRYERMHLNRMRLEEDFSNEIAGRPEEIWLLKPSDLANLPALTVKLREAKDPVSQYLRDHCSENVRRQLREYNAATPSISDLRENLVNSLNIVLKSDGFYEKERFLSVKLSPRIKSLLNNKKLTGLELVKLNRYLIEDAYPDYITGIEAVPIDIQAESLEYDGDKNILIGSGHFRMQKGEELLRCDNAIVNQDSYDVLAEGNVQFERGSDIWIGKKLRYNFLSKKGDFGIFAAYMEPFYVHAESSKRVGENEYLLKDAVLSTCEGENPRAFFRVKTARIIPGHHIYARNVFLYVGGVPVMYCPYWAQNIGDPNFISIVPGYNSRMWAFLLTTFNYRLSRNIEAKSHIDVRVRRGLAVGQDILWSSSGNAKGLSTEKYEGALEDEPWAFGMRSADRWEKSGAEEEEEDKWSGDLITYYAYDLWPDEGKSHDYPIPNDRYRVRLTHNQNIDEQDYAMLQANYISDPYIIEQFFREEYKTDPEPDNYLVLGRRGQYYAASLMFRKRFNDFYTSVDRLPEATLDFTRQQIWDSPFYYEGKHTAAYLSKEWEKNLAASNANYSAFRLDTPNMIYYPTKQFGFLAIIPRAGWEGTLYSAGVGYYTNTTTTSYVDTNGVTRTTVTSNVFSRSTDAQLRSMPKLGVETSFKAFKVWETYPGTIINNIRHIAEPYADYSFTPEPNVLSTNLYQFDEIDTLGKKNEIKFGMRNKIQTQRFNKLEPSSRRHTIAELINADIWTTYRVAPEEGQNIFTNISYDIRSTPVDGVGLYLDGEYDQYENHFHTINTRLALSDDPIWRYEVEHRYLEDSNSLLNNELKLSPFPKWAYSIYVRYDFYDQHMEAYGITIQKTMECVTAKIGFEQQLDDDFTIWLQFWFTQFPKVRADVGL